MLSAELKAFYMVARLGSITLYPGVSGGRNDR